MQKKKKRKINLIHKLYKMYFFFPFGWFLDVHFIHVNDRDTLINTIILRITFTLRTNVK